MKKTNKDPFYFNYNVVECENDTNKVQQFLTSPLWLVSVTMYNIIRTLIIFKKLFYVVIYFWAGLDVCLMRA